MNSVQGAACVQERREVEQALFRGELMAVAATNALELGVDIGSLDITLHLGFPGGPCWHAFSRPEADLGRPRTVCHAAAQLEGVEGAKPASSVGLSLTCWAMQARWRRSGSRLAGRGGGSRPPPPFTSPLMGPWTSTTSSTLTSCLGAPLSTAR